MPIVLAARKQPSDHFPSDAIVALIKHFEGFVPYAYDDKEPRNPKTRITPENAHTVKGKLTIGYGRARNVQPGDTCTLQQAEQWLREDIEVHAQIVRRDVKVPLTQGEFDALTDIVYNIGYVPRSMLACLNGGTTDKDLFMTPGSYGSAVREFPRNCRWGGIPDEAIYRRRLADACVFSGLPWEAACSKNLVKMVHNNGAIDPFASTSLEDTLMRARMDIPDQRPSPVDVFNKPWPKPELPLTNPLPPAATAVEAKGAEPALSPNPAPARASDNSQPPPAPVVLQPKADAKPVGEASPPRPAPLPLPPISPKYAPPPAPKVEPPPARDDPPIISKLPPYSVPSPGVPGPVAPPIPPAPPNMKRLDKSRRYWGLAIFHGGRLLMILGATTLPGTFAVTFGHIYGAVVADPQLFSAVINALAFTTGLIMDTVGGWLHKIGGNHAQTVLVAGNEAGNMVVPK